jgi:hypothetical protein
MSTNNDRKEVDEIEYSIAPRMYGTNKPLQSIDDDGKIVFSFTSGLKIVTGYAIKAIINEYDGFPLYVDAVNGFPEVKVLDAYLCIDEKHQN